MEAYIPEQICQVCNYPGQIWDAYKVSYHRRKPGYPVFWFRHHLRQRIQQGQVFVDAVVDVIVVVTVAVIFVVVVVVVFVVVVVIVAVVVVVVQYGSNGSYPFPNGPPLFKFSAK